MPRLWNAVAEGYSREIAPHFAKYGEDALLLAGVGPGSRVIDVACGPGAVAPRHDAALVWSRSTSRRR